MTHDLQQILSRLGRIALVLLACAGTSACWEQTISVMRKENSSVHQQGVRFVRVGVLRGFGGDELHQLVTHQLVKAGDIRVVGPLVRNGAPPPYAEQQERPIDSILAAAYPDADATLTGTVLTPRVSFAYHTQENQSGERFTTTYTRTTSIWASGVFQLVNTQDGKILDSFEVHSEPVTLRHTRTLEGHAASDGGFISSLFFQLDIPYESRAAYPSLRDKLVRSFTPKQQPAVLHLWRSSFTPQDVVVARRAAEGDWAPALKYYSERTKADLGPKEQAEAMYYYGMALAYSGDMLAGLEQLEASRQLVPSTVTDKALQELSKF